MSSRSNSQFVVASVTEFLSVLAHGGKASLNLSTSDGLTTVPSYLFSFLLASPSRASGKGDKSSAPASPVVSTAPVMPTSSSEPVISKNSDSNPNPTNISSNPVTASVISMSSSPPSKESSDELLCNICNFKGVYRNGLKIHKGHKHENIPQVDGEASQERDTDFWWERNLSHRLKTYEVYKNVLLDIDKSTLSEEEKVSERENVTNIRKKELGSNYIYCPPWNS